MLLRRRPRPVPLVTGTIAGLVVIAVVVVMIVDRQQSAPDTTVSAPPCEVRIDVTTSPNKFQELTDIAAAYNQTRRCPQHPVTIHSESSGDTLSGLASASWQPSDHNGQQTPPQVWSPAAAEWLALLELRGKARQASVTVTNGPWQALPAVTTTARVLAIPEAIAGSLEARLGPIGWSTIFDLARDQTRWEAVREPSWGPLGLGRTNPESSTNGLNALVEEFTYATGVGSPDRLTPDGIQSPGAIEAVRQIENATLHYGENTLDYLCNLARADAQDQALRYVTMVPVSEKSVVEYNEGRQASGQGGSCQHAGRPPTQKLRAVYPTEGVIMSSEPYAILSTASQPQQQLAQHFLQFVQQDDQQRIFQRQGFRHASTEELLPETLNSDSGRASRLRSKVSEANRRQLPTPEVLGMILEAWDSLRKPARLILLLDLSGSMNCSITDPRKGNDCTPVNDGSDTRFTLARKGQVDAFLPATLLGSQDQIGLWTFNGGPDISEPCKVRHTPSANRSELGKALNGLDNPSGGTPLYRCVRQAQQWLADQQDRKGYINAVIVLSDGEDDYTGEPLAQVESDVRSTFEGSGVRIFPIAYVLRELDSPLSAIAAAAGGTLYKANDSTSSETDPKSIGLVLRKVLNTF